MSEEMRTGFAGVVERLRAEGQLTRNSGANSLKSLRDTLAGELSSLGEGLENVSNSIAEASTATPRPAPQSAEDREDADDQRNIFQRMLGTLDAIQRGVTGGRDAVRDERGFGKLLALFGAGMGGLLTALGPFVKILKSGLILGAVYFALDAFEEMLNFFENPSWEGLGNILTSIGTALLLVIAAFPMKTLALIKALPRSFRLLRVFFMRTLPNFFRGIMPTIAGKLMRVLRFISTAFTALRVFFIGTLLPMLSGFLATLTPIIVAAAPFIAIGAAIAFAFFAVYKGVKAFIDKFKETGSIMDGLIAMGTTILTLPFTLIKDLISWFADLLGFENFSKMLDSIDFAASAFEFISGLVDDIVGFFTGLFDIDFMEVIKKIPGAGTVLKLIDKAASVGSAVSTFLGFGDDGAEVEAKADKARDEELAMKQAGALGRDRETGQIKMVTRLQTGMSKKRASEMSVRQRGLELVSPEERKMYEDKMSERTRKAEQALREFEAAPKLSDMISNVTGKMSGVFSGVRDSVVGGFDAVVNIGSGIGETIKGAFNTVVDTVTDFIAGIGDAIFEFFGFPDLLVTQLFAGFFTPMEFLNDFIITPIGNLFTDIGNSISNFFNDMIDSVTDFILGIGQEILQFFMPDNVMLLSEMSPMEFLNTFVITPITDLFTSIGNSISDFFSNMVDTVTDFILDIGQSILQFFVPDNVMLLSELSPMEFLYTFVITPISNLFTSIGNSITDFFNNMVDTVTDFILDIGQSILEFFFPDTSMVFSELSPMDFIRNFIIDPLANFFTDIGLKFFDFFGIDALPLFISDVSPIEFFKGFILDPIKNFFTNALTTVGEFFQSIMNFDFLQFIKDNVPGAETALKIIGGIGSAVSSLFGSDDDPVTEDDRRQALGMTGEERRIAAARMQVKDMTDRLTNAAMTNNSGDDAKSVNTTVNAPVNNISNSSPTTVTSTPIVPGNMSLQAMRQASSA